MAYQSRPLPNPPDSPVNNTVRTSNVYPLESPTLSPYSRRYAQPELELYEEPAIPAIPAIPAGTFLHKGFYDLLAMIPTPSPSRLIWGAPLAAPEQFLAGPRYEEQLKSPGIKASPKKGRRISKDMVSKPTGFVYNILKCYLDAATDSTS